MKELGEVASQRRTGVKPGQIDPTTPYIALEHMPKRCVSLSGWGTACGLASSKFKFQTGDILFGKLRPYFHKVGVAALDGVCSTDIVVVVPASPGWFGFVLGHVSSTTFVGYTDATSTGTRMPRTKWADMARYKVPLPPCALARAFNCFVHPVFCSMLTAIHGSRHLAATRDELIPVLMAEKTMVAP